LELRGLSPINTDPMKLMYRAEITDVVGCVVKNVMDKMRAVRHIKEFAEQRIGTENGKLFVEVCETELSNLHEGKIAKFKVKPSEYQTWQQSWE